MDEWIYFFKNNEVLDGFKAKGMKAVREKLIVHNLPDEDRKQYNRFLDNLHTEASIADTVRIEQEEKKAKERMNEQNKMALKCIKRGDTNEEIMEVTELSFDEIEELRKDTPSV